MVLLVSVLSALRFKSYFLIKLTCSSRVVVPVDGGGASTAAVVRVFVEVVLTYSNRYWLLLGGGGTLSVLLLLVVDVALAGNGVALGATATEDLLCRMWLLTRSLLTRAAIRLSSPAITVAQMTRASCLAFSAGWVG